MPLDVLVRRTAVFLGGVAAPLLLLLVPYALTGAVGSWVHGVFVLPRLRLHFAEGSSPPWSDMVIGAAAALPLALAPVTRRRPQYVLASLVGSTFVILGIVKGVGAPVHLAMSVARAVVSVLALVGACRLALAPAEPVASTAASRPWHAMVLVVALFSLIQYPFPATIYLFYVVPLSVITVGLMLAPDRPWRSSPVPLLYFAVFLGLGVANAQYWRAGADTRLALARGGLWVGASDARRYEGLATALDSLHVGDTIWATPDAPEVYYLSGRRNATRTLFDFFDDPRGRTGRIMALLDSGGVSAVVLKHRVQIFSPEPGKELLDGIRARFPVTTELDGFTLMTRGHTREP